MRGAAITQPEVRSRILECAERLFRAYGYAKTTVTDIATDCGMSPANVYRFFESKAALNEAIIGVVLERMEAIAEAIVRERRSAAARLRKFVLESHRFTCEQYVQDAKVHEIVARAMDEQWAVIDAHVERMRRVCRTIVEDGVQAGEFSRGRIEERCQCVFNAMMPFCHPQLVAEKFADDHGRQAAAMADFLVAALRGGGPAAKRRTAR